MGSTEDPPKESLGDKTKQQNQGDGVLNSSPSEKVDEDNQVDSRRSSSDDDKADITRQIRRVEERRRWWLFGFSAVYTFLYVGSFYGWGPMQLLLEDNGAFSWKCASSSTSSSSSNNEVCSEQTYSLLRINLIATVTQILSPLLGQFVDTHGSRRGFYFMMSSLLIGLVLLTTASSRSLPSTTENGISVVALDRLLYVAFCFMAMATWMGGLLTVNTGLFFTGHARSRVIFILNSLFDAGSITYLFLWWLGEALPNASLTIVVGGFLGSAVIIMSGALYFWIVTVPQEEENEIETKRGLRSRALGVEDTVDISVSETKTRSSHVHAKEREEEIKRNEQEKETRHTSDESERLRSTRHQSSSLTQLYDYVIVADRTPRQQLLSTPYLLLCTYFAIQTTSNQWNLATQRDFLAYLGDDEQGNKYLTIFTLLMPASVVALPLVDYAILHFGFSGAFQTINALALGYTTIKVSSDNLNVQILGFCLFSFYRCFLFGVSISFLPTLVGPNVVGKGVGILYAVAGVLSFINIPFAKLAVEKLDGNFFIPNLIYCLLVIPCILLAFLIGRQIKKEERAKQIQAEMKETYSKEEELDVGS